MLPAGRTPSEHVAIAPVHLAPLDCFLAYCLHVTLETYNKSAATGLSSRSVLERMSEIQMLDVTIPVTDGRELRMRRYTKPEKVHHLLLANSVSPYPASPHQKFESPDLWWRPFDKTNAISSISPPPTAEQRKSGYP